MKRGTLLYVALTSITLLGLELVWTRLFSAEFFYTFAFLILSLAVMGLGLGALAIRLFPSLDKDSRLGVYLALTGLFALISPPLVFRVNVDFTQLYGNWGMIWKLFLTIDLLAAAFFFGGMALAIFFKRNIKEIASVYMSDLLGAGMGVFLAIYAMNRFGTPEIAVWIAAPVLIAALFTSRRLFKIVPLGLLVGLYFMSGYSAEWLEVKQEERAPVIYKHWDSMSKVKLYAFSPDYRGINVDNVANSPVIRFDGDWKRAEEEAAEGGWMIDVGYLINRFDDCTFLSLGSGGGGDVLQALSYGATEVHAVEVNPHVNKMMTVGDPAGYITRDSSVVDSTGRIITCAEFSGHLYDDPRVIVASEDARTYVKRFEDKFDVIYSLSSNTWAALGSGAFALAENYIFTKEAFKDYWKALSPNGYLSMEHQVYMPRLVAEVIDALEEMGIPTPEKHIAVYNLPKARRNLLLLSKQPLTDEVRNLAYRELTPDRHPEFHLLYPAPADSLENNIINQIVTYGWELVADTAKVNLSPSTDDRPFVAQLGLWRNLEGTDFTKINRYAEFRGFPMSKLVLLIILGVVVVVAFPLMLLPYFFSREKLKPGPWLYFFLIGVAFMSVEVVLIQKYTLFIGASVYSIAAVLVSLLISSSLGAGVSDRVSHKTAFWGIIILLILEAVFFRQITGGLVYLSTEARALVAAMMVAPVGFFMGMPFPKAASRVGELVDWGFAVNGVASVVGGTAIVLVSFTFGFTAALLLGAALYLLAYWLYSSERAW
jgi:hypothetical protein